MGSPCSDIAPLDTAPHWGSWALRLGTHRDGSVFAWLPRCHSPVLVRTMTSLKSYVPGERATSEVHLSSSPHVISALPHQAHQRAPAWKRCHRHCHLSSSPRVMPALASPSFTVCHSVLVADVLADKCPATWPLALSISQELCRCFLGPSLAFMYDSSISRKSSSGDQSPYRLLSRSYVLSGRACKVCWPHYVRAEGHVSTEDGLTRS